MPCLVKRNGDDLCALFKMLLSEDRFHAAMVGHFPVVVIGGGAGGGGGERLRELMLPKKMVIGLFVKACILMPSLL